MRMRAVIDVYHRCLSIALVASVAVLIIPVSLQIFSRYTELIPSYIWTEEMARFFFIWMIMLGAMVGIREGTHFDVDLWPELAPRANALLRIVSNVFVLVFALFFLLVRHRLRGSSAGTRAPNSRNFPCPSSSLPGRSPA